MKNMLLFRKPKGLLFLSFVMLFMFNSQDSFAQPWVYNFGTGTGTFTNSTASVNTFLPTPSSGSSRVRVGTNPGSFALVNPGLSALGSGTELQFTSNTGSVSTSKFSIYDWTTATKVGYVKFGIAFSGGSTGVYRFTLGDGANFSDSNAMSAAQTFASIEWVLTTSSAVSYRVMNTAGSFITTGLTNPTSLFVQTGSPIYSVEVYANNESTSQNYTRSGANTLAAGTWDLWVDGVKVGNNLARGSLANNVNFDSFAFNHQVSAATPGTIYLDDIEYSNSLPSAPTALLTSQTLGSAFTTTYGTASTAVETIATGTNLTAATLTATPQTNFEVSVTSATTGFQSTPITGITASASLWVRLANNAPASGSYNNVTCVVLSGGGAASNANITTLATGNSVSKGTPIISVSPTASGITYGQTLASSTLTGGTSSVAGSFAFTTPSTAPNAGTANQGITFTPTDTANYNNATGLASVFVDTKALSITANNVSKANGDTLTGGAGSTAFNSSGLLSPETIGSVTINYGAGAAVGDPDGVYVGSVVASNAIGGTFNPSNYAITYNPGDITVTSVAGLTPATTTLTSFTTTYGTPSIAQSVIFTGVSLPGAITTSAAPTGYEVSSDGTIYGSTASLSSTGGTLYVRLSASATVSGSYDSQVITLTSGATSATVTTAASGNTVSKATPTISVAPTASNITFGQTLASSNLTGGTASTAGTFAFTTPSTAPNAGTASQGVTFTPTDTNNYNTATTTTNVTVDKASTTIIVAPTASNITYGQTLASSLLTEGTASVAGTFAFTTPSTAPNAGTADQGITFIPTDSVNYNNTTGLASVTVDKANQTISNFAATDTRVLGAANYNLGATASSGGAVTYSNTNNTTVASISGNTVTIIGTGTSVITATQAGDSNYNPVSVDQTLTVTYPVLAGWDVSTLTNNGPSPYSASTSDSNVTVVGLTRGSTLTTNTTGAVWGGDTWTTAADLSAAVTNNKFVTFSVTANTGKKVSIKNIASYNARRSSSGPNSGQWQYKVGNGSFINIGSTISYTGTATAGNVMPAIDLSGISDLQNVVAGTTVTFRLANWGATSAGGTWFLRDLGNTTGDDFIINGITEVAPPTVTTNLATVTSPTAATLNGTVNANGNATTASFDYGTVVTATTPALGAVTGASNTATSVNLTGLSVNTQYTYKAFASGGTGGTINGSNVTFYTFANTPSTPVVNNALETSIDVAIGSGDGNPSGTLYAIQVNNGSYVQAGGASLGAAVWQTATAWGTTTVSNLNCITSYNFKVYAKNGDGVITTGTSASLSTTACTIPSIQADSLAGFNAICINTSSTNNFALLGLNLISDVSVNSLTGFAFSTDNVTFSSSLTLTPVDGEILETIYVKFTPTIAQSYSTSPISITGGGTSGITVAVIASGINTPVSGVTVGAISGTTAVSLTFGATTFTQGCSAVSASGIQYSTDNTFSSSIVTNGSSATISGLSPNTLYNYRAFATDATGTVNGSTLNFTTSGLSAPTANDASSVAHDEFTANWSAVDGATKYFLDVSTSSTFGITNYATNLIISEYGEGSSGNKKYIEIYNGTGASVNLDNYQVWGIANGGVWPESTVSLTGILANNSTYVIANNATDVPGANLYVAFATSPAISFNGNDAVGIAYNGGSGSIFSLLDVVGDTSDPVTGWSVAGTTDATKDKIIIRKATVLSPNTNWTISAGTTVSNSEWTVSSGTYSATTDTTNLFQHTMNTTSTPIFVSGYENLDVSNVTSYVVDTNIAPLTQFYYRVRAFSTNSTSANSNTKSVTTTAAPPTFGSVSQSLAETICDGSEGTFNITGLLPQSTSTITYNINGGANQTVTNVVANLSGFATFGVTLPASFNGQTLTVTQVERTDVTSPVLTVTTNNTAVIAVQSKYLFYVDGDGDGYGTATSSMECSSSAAVAPTGFSTNDDDCNDANDDIHPGAAEVCFNNIDDDCDGLFSEDCPPILTSIPSYTCGTTLDKINSTITAKLPTNTSSYLIGYMFRITNLSTNVTVDLPRSIRSFQLTMTNIATYNTSYLVSVAAVVNGEVQAFSTPCTISTPSIPTSNIARCGTAMAGLTSNVVCYSVTSAIGYQFEISLASDPLVKTEIIRSLNSFTMVSLNGLIPLYYDTDYSVRVKVKVLIDGIEVWGDYGSSCIVTTPLGPEIFIVGCVDPSITPASMTTNLFANSISGATMYRFTLVNTELGYEQVIEKPVRYFSLAEFNTLSPLVLGEVYSVFVDAMIYGAYNLGKDCSITVPLDSSRMRDEIVEFEATTYPNPFSNNFIIDVKTSSQSVVSVKVYDMIGRLVDQSSLNVADLKHASIGDQYPSGVYNLVITQDGLVKTLRVVKR